MGVSQAEKTKGTSSGARLAAAILKEARGNRPGHVYGTQRHASDIAAWAAGREHNGFVS